jgi:hypothetical protein
VHVAAFVTSHGFGHAGRASALLEALHARRPDLRVELFTDVADSFLRSSLALPYTLVRTGSDHGMVQRGPFHADLDATAEVVEKLVDGLPAAADEIGARLRRSGCTLVLCDIDPLGIVAAERAGVPSVLVENFRWDWIYAGLPEAPASLRTSAARLGRLYGRADLHLQVEPLCDPVERGVRIERPIARGARRSRDEVRTTLGLGPSERVVLVTTGGVPAEPGSLERCFSRADVTFLITGAARTERRRNVVLFAQDEPIYLPDLVRAADGVVAKLGYSTLAETWREGRPLLRVPRSAWPEGPVLSRWADAHMPGFEVPEAAFLQGEWLERIDELLAQPAGAPQPRAGQDDAAEAILQRIA